MSGLLLLVVHLWGLSLLIFVLHYYNPRFGFAPLIMTLGAITVLTQNQFGIFVQPVPSISLSVNANVLVPVIIFAVLLMYIANGAVPARMTVYGVVGINVLTLIGLLLYRTYLSLDGGGSFSGLPVDQVVPAINARITLGSLVAFLADMFVIAVFYQGTRNFVPKMPEWVVIGLSLLAALWTDALLFRLIAHFGRADFATLMTGDIIGKTLSAFILWMPLAFYLTRIAPTLPGYVGAANRHTLDVLFGSLEETKLELVRTEQALAKSEAERRKESEHLRLISENINEALWVAGPKPTDHAFYINHAYELIWGRSAATIYAQEHSFVDSIHPEDRDRIVAGLHRQREGNYDVEYRMIRPDGNIRWIRDRAFPVYDESGALFRIVGIAEDITERQQLEKQQLELAVEREKVKLLRDFIGETSHDLKNPLTSMSLKIEYLQRLQDPVRIHQQLKDLEMLTERMSKMIDDLVMLTRLENLRELPLISVNINRIIDEICTTMRPMLDEKKLELSLELKNGEVTMYASANDIERALANLIDNAVNYTPQGGTIRVQTESREHEVMIRVADSGIGIPEKDQLNIFNRFYRGSNVRGLNGTGLGLAIVKKVVDQHQGQIEVSSIIGTGTTFIMHLPKAE
jgi:PAS domain S-box-containing protein